MKLTLNWLKKYLHTDLSAEEISTHLTKLGLELDSLIDRKSDLSVFTVAHIIKVEKHPNAEKLKVCTVDDGISKLQIVCGAPNARENIKVVLAKVGAIIPNGNFAIKSSEIRGVKSEGMLCSAEELNISGDSEGIIELVNDAKVGDLALSYLGLDDVIFEVDLTPNRADCFGVYGIARDMAAKKLGALKPISVPKFSTDFDPSVKVEIKSKDCTLFTIREIKNIKNTESPKWLKDLLKNVGLEPISAIVDITNYFSLGFARPMHAYDRSKIGSLLIVENLKDSVKFNALNGKTYEFSSPDLVIRDEQNILTLAGIIGGENSKCSSETTNIILEAAVFDKVAITMAGRKHNIITDSRTRFERGVDHNQTCELLDLATSMILEICGGQASTVSVSGVQTIEKKKIEFNIGLLKKRIGITKSKSEIFDILKNLGFEIEDNGDVLNLAVPTWRHDVEIAEVIAEEIARISDFDNLAMNALPILENFDRVLTIEQTRIDEARRTAASIGYHEVITWSFMPSKQVELFAEVNQDMFIKNPISSDLDYMRPSIIPNLVMAVSSNIKRSISNISLFEVGPIFKDLTMKGESQVLSAIICGNKTEKTHNTLERHIDIFDIKSDLESLIIELGYSADKLLIEQSAAPKYYHPGRSGAFKIGKQVIAYFGELHPSILTRFDIKLPTCAFEIFMEDIPLPRSKFGRRPHLKLSPYQSNSRDFAFILDDAQKAGDVLKTISSVDKLIKKAEIFDLYKGANLPDNKKSIAIRITAQADDRTLTDIEIEAICAAVVKQIAERYGGELRK